MSVPASAGVSSDIGECRHRDRLSSGALGPVRLEWIDVFETGNVEIDAFHRRLIQDCNRLLLLVESDSAWPLIVGEARRFLEHCIEHFRAE